jgi:hypothetical protein
MSQREASEIADAVMRRNVFARHSRENDFYVRRARELGDTTVVELYRPGDPADMSDRAAGFARRLEQLAVISTALTVTRKDLHRRLGISARSPQSIDFVIGPDYRYLRSTRPRTSPSRGVLVDATFLRRYERCGFPKLAEVLVAGSAMGNRVADAVSWLFQSRTDPDFHAAITKTAIGLETLLITSDSEGLTHSLSERAALILSQDPAVRPRVSKIVRRFYDARSCVVHGNAKKQGSLEPALLEAADRLVLLLCLLLAANIGTWASPEDMRQWCEGQRWGNPAADVLTPFPSSYLRNAVALAESALA